MWAITISLFIQAINFRYVSLANSGSILTNMAILLLANIPFVCADVDKVYLLAGIGDVASYSHWIEKTVANVNILEGNVTKSDSGLGGASSFFIEGIKHATGSITIWLFHLLGPDVNCPP